MNDEQTPPNSFWEMVRWDGCLPLVAIGSRFALTLWIGKEDATLVAALIVTPVVAIVRTRYANRQIQRLGLKHAYDRKICMAAAIVTLAAFEFYAIIFQSDPTVPLVGWLIPVGIYMVYLALVSIALRPVHRIKPIDADEDFWTSRPVDK
ncbi:MAG TPA: hypothetical protein VGJ26_10710 [Pirellulales bacterium]